MNPILPGFGAGDKEYTLSILIISTGHYCEVLSNALHTEKRIKGYQYKLQVHTCENVNDVLQSDRDLHIDFIVFFLDVRRRTCLTEVDLNISQLDQSFLCGRICFARESDITPLELAVSINEIWNMKSKYGLNLLLGSFRNKSTSLHLAERILILASRTIGMKSGIPYIDWPKRHDGVASSSRDSSSDSS